MRNAKREAIIKKAIRESNGIIRITDLERTTKINYNSLKSYLLQLAMSGDVRIEATDENGRPGCFVYLEESEE